MTKATAIQALHHPAFNPGQTSRLASLPQLRQGGAKGGDATDMAGDSMKGGEEQLGRKEVGRKAFI